MKSSSYCILFLAIINTTLAQRESLSSTTLAGPGPLFSLGQNLVDKHTFTVGGGLWYREGYFNHRLRYTVGGLYGITDRLVALVSIPIILNDRLFENHSSGAGDIICDLEYAYFQKKYDQTLIQATILTGVGFPTSDTKKKFPVDYGTWSGFVGITNSFTRLPFYCFLSGGATIFKQRHEHEFGNLYNYESGCGIKLINLNTQDFVSILLEMNGILITRAKVNGRIQSDSGRNVVFLGPVLRLDWKTLTIQGGIQFPAWQHFFNSEQNFDYRAAFSISGGF